MLCKLRTWAYTYFILPFVIQMVFDTIFLPVAACNVPIVLFSHSQFEEQTALLILSEPDGSDESKCNV